MNKFLEIILDWSEVWALLIPLIIIIIYREQHRAMRPVIIYVIVALVLNSFSTVSYFFHEHMRGFMRNNNIFYNLHSIARVIFFGWFLYNVTPEAKGNLYKIILGLYAVFIVINFIFIETPLYFSSWIFAAESIVLISFCILFFLKIMQDDSTINWTRHRFFLVATGILLYEATTFFIFLFILPMAEKNPDFGLLSLKLYKMMFVILCILIAIALYKNKRIPAAA